MFFKNLISRLFKSSLKEKEETIDYYKSYFSESHNFPTLSINYENVTYSTYIDKWEKDIVTFAAPMKGTNFLRIPKDTNLPVFLIFADQIFSTELKIIERYMEENECLYTAKVLGGIKKKGQ